MKRFLPMSWCLVLVLASGAWSQDPDLRLHFNFDDEDALAVDVSGNDVPAELDDLGGVQWLEDDVRGGVIEFPGSTNGYILAEIPPLPGDSFTIAFWAYRDPLLAGGGGGANDGLFQVQFGIDAISGTEKIIGGWVQKSDSGVWGRIIQEDFTTVNLDRGSFFMDDEEWVHLAYRGNGEELEVIVNGESGIGPIAFYDGTMLENDAIVVGRQGTETWGGRMDDFRVYSRALTDDEIIEIMAGGGGNPGVLGDFDKSGVLDVADINLLSQEVIAGTNPTAFDLDNNNLVNQEDRRVWVEDLFGTYFGDSNLDGEFSSADFVTVFTAGEYEDTTPGNSTWGTGDWNGDGDFNSSDFVTAFTAGGYELGPRPANAGVASVPEPATSSLIFCVAFALLGVVRKRTVSQRC
ncbi:MAG: hypothetical protein KDA87_06155 [Planctomycetales bacterium]|nr:hypothetical protein [Planctomycetales bacterium]